MKDMKKKGMMLTLATTAVSSTLVTPMFSKVEAMELGKDGIAEYTADVLSEENEREEIIKYNPDNEKYYLVNEFSQQIDVMSLQSVDESLVIEFSIDIQSLLNRESVEIIDFEMSEEKQVLLVAISSETKIEPDQLVMLDYEGNLLKSFNLPGGVQGLTMPEHQQVVFSLNYHPGTEVIAGDFSLTMIDLLNESSHSMPIEGAAYLEASAIELEIVEALNDEILLCEDERMYALLKNKNAYVCLDIETKQFLKNDSDCEEESIEALEVDYEILGVVMINGIDYQVIKREGKTEFIALEETH